MRENGGENDEIYTKSTLKTHKYLKKHWATVGWSVIGPNKVHTGFYGFRPF